jgi:sulfide:quinone oxidoreductase
MAQEHVIIVPVGSRVRPRTRVDEKACVTALFRDQEPSAKNPGAGSCYIEFGANRIARVDVDFFSGPKPTGTFHEPSEALRADKKSSGATRSARWFGRA